MKCRSMSLSSAGQFSVPSLAEILYSAPSFELVLPVQSQAEAAVITTIASAAIVEQVLARDGTLNTHATYLLTTSRGA